MVHCAHCGVHLPRGEALLDGAAPSAARRTVCAGPRWALRLPGEPLAPPATERRGAVGAAPPTPAAAARRPDESWFGVLGVAADTQCAPTSLSGTASGLRRRLGRRRGRRPARAVAPGAAHPRATPIGADAHLPHLCRGACGHRCGAGGRHRRDQPDGRESVAAAGAAVPGLCGAGDHAVAAAALRRADAAAAAGQRGAAPPPVAGDHRRRPGGLHRAAPAGVRRQPQLRRAAGAAGADGRRADARACWRWPRPRRWR